MKNIAEEYAHRIWNEKDLHALKDFLHPKIVIHSLLGDFQDREQMKKVVEAWLVAFPDLVVTNTAIISENDTVVIQWKATGTHKGEFKGIAPTGRNVAYAGVTIYKIFDGKIIEYWAYLDMQHLINQLK